MGVCITTSATQSILQKKVEKVDRISEMPIEILALILSHLTIIEAVRTSVLSHKWKKLWKYFTGNFDFRAPDRFRHGLGLGGGGGSHYSYFSGESTYVCWVTNVVNSHRGQTLNAFRVFFKLGKKYEHELKSWIDFAIKKRVQILQLDFGLGLDDDNCTFPLLPSHSFFSFKSLSVLYLSRIDVTDQVVSNFLSHCPLLEELSVRYSFSLVDVQVVAPDSLKLKHLEISSCPNVKSIEISAVNLVSFKFGGQKIALACKNAPLLAQVDIGGAHCNCLVSDLGGLLLVHPSQLERLVLDLSSMDPEEAMLVFARGFPEFTKLNYLELGLELEAQDKHSILFLTSMIEACPSLQRFRLEVTNFGMMYSFENVSGGYLPNDLWKRVSERRPSKEDMKYLDRVDPNFPLGSRYHPCLYKCLEVVDLGGFSGHAAELELVIFLVRNGSRLERITIDPHCPKIPNFHMDLSKLEMARERAKQVQTKLPSETELVIL